MAASGRNPRKTRLPRIGPRAVFAALLVLSAPLALAATGPAPTGPAATGPAAPPDDLTTLSLEQLMDLRVVYAASKHDESTLAAPAAVTVITAEEIREFGYRSVADILNGVRGFFTTYDRNYRYVGVRGFARPGDYNSRLLLLIDGYRINDNIYDAAQVGPELSLDVDLIERVEVVRGPSSSLYGTSAFFGVVNIITKTAREMPGLNGAVGVASWATFEGAVDYGRVWGDHGSILVSGSGWDSGGQDLFYPEFDTPANNDGVAEDADYESGARFRAAGSAGDWSFEASHGSREKGIPTGAFSTVFGDTRTRTVDAQTYASARWARTLPGAVDFEARLAYNRYDYHGYYVLDYGTPGNPFIVVNNDTALGEWWTADVQAAHRFGGHQRLIGGSEYRLNTRQDQRNYDLADYLDDERTSDVLGLYVEDEIAWGRQVTVNVGVRHDQYDTFGGTTNPRLAIIWAPGPHTAVKLLGGRAFRAPNNFELYYNDNGVSEKGNPDLSPETIRTTEIVLEHFLNERVLLTGAAYTYTIDDLISETLDPSDGLLVFENVSEVRARGLELEIEGRLASGLHARFSWATQWSHDETTGTTLTNSPRNLGKLLLAVPAWSGRLTTGIEMLYVGDRVTLQDHTAAAHLLMNLTVTGRLRNGKTEIQGSVYNVPDLTYADPGSGEHVQDTIEQDGRNFRLILRHRF
ncbi:MAG TPA: TonB-dependent receptor [Patescibacteria group bacterium]|nr:TonB-dependent receptor [Patescibacteria group bacterium]